MGRRAMRHAVDAAGLWLAALAMLGCPSTTSSRAEAGEAVVRRFFQALPSGDCAVLGPMLVTGQGVPPCEETVKDLREHGMGLVDVLDAKVDGRDPDAVVVRARVSLGGAERAEPFLFRVERQDEAWRLRL
ncbi:MULTISPECIES: hypothetical protein [unclassified Corallococcus]|uniref:hypothetical protein n=1 Tax=unclassified Corallococcus TaxID=2685029 RepID=UPI001A904FF1|nr:MULTISPECIES: hypothetical protein [unclassified Corallococcus]MBN9681119.1 hypothetical protein [Corallococcus sp. NCSPR001]WAS87288.1 hypothetical protein O0N60_09980 [Corallococcus sp. NCRR]